MTTAIPASVKPAPLDDTLRVGTLARFYEAVLWRRRVATQQAFIRRTFRDSDEILQAHDEELPLAKITLRDGRCLMHPDRPGLVDTLVELWHHRGYTQGLYRPKAGDVVVDAGANVGIFSAYLLRSCPTVRVLPIEPSPENLIYLKQNLATFGGNPEDIASTALGPESGEVDLILSERSLDHRVAAIDSDSASIASSPSVDCVRVPVQTLEEVLDRAGVESAAFLKLDIEGAEYTLFDGIADATLRRFERIAIEPHPEIAKRPADDLIRRLSGLFDVRWYGPLIQARRR